MYNKITDIIAELLASINIITPNTFNALLIKSSVDSYSKHVPLPIVLFLSVFNRGLGVPICPLALFLQNQSIISVFCFNLLLFQSITVLVSYLLLHAYQSPASFNILDGEFYISDRLGFVALCPFAFWHVLFLDVF